MFYRMRTFNWKIQCLSQKNSYLYSLTVLIELNSALCYLKYTVFFFGRTVPCWSLLDWGTGWWSSHLSSPGNPTWGYNYITKPQSYSFRPICAHSCPFIPILTHSYPFVQFCAALCKFVFLLCLSLPIGSPTADYNYITNPLSYSFIAHSFLVICAVLCPFLPIGSPTAAIII